MKSFFSIFYFFVSMSLALGQENISSSHMKAAYKTLYVLNITDMYDGILSKTAISLKKEFIQQWPGKQELINEIVTQKSLSFVSRRADLEKEAATIYAHSFSEEELEKIYTFYSSQAGKKLLKVAPDLMRELVAVGEVWARGLKRDLAESIQKEILSFKNKVLETSK